MAHKFKVGQTVELERSMLRSLAPGRYEIRHLIPSSDRDPGEPCYRIKSLVEKHERAASESELKLSVGVFT
jgi:nitrate reductase beta subunit